MHGGTSPGAPRGEANGNFRSGLYTREMLELRAMIREARKSLRELHGF
jgi:hypothetical protein